MYFVCPKQFQIYSLITTCYVSVISRTHLGLQITSSGITLTQRKIFRIKSILLHILVFREDVLCRPKELYQLQSEFWDTVYEMRVASQLIRTGNVEETRKCLGKKSWTWVRRVKPSCNVTLQRSQATNTLPGFDTTARKKLFTCKE